MEFEAKDKFVKELFNEKYETLCYYVGKETGDKAFAEDVVQETFLELWRKAEDLQDHPNLSGWLYLTARNKMLKLGKKKSQLYPVEDSKLLIAGREKEYEEIEFTESMKSLISETEYEMLRDYYIGGYSAADIAKKYKIKKGGVRMRILRIKKKLGTNILKGWIFFLICVWEIFNG